MRSLGFLFILSIFLLACSQKNPPASDPDTEQIEAILAQMTLVEKIGQTAQRGTSSRVKGALPEALKIAVREGRVGSMINVMNKEFVDELQRIAVEESPQGIPLIFARDVIHGFKTIFPIPLGQAATWHPQIVEQGARIAAIEASTYGVRWTFAPMLDIARDPRWGRIAESPGEDPYLASLLAEAYVKGFQGQDLKDPTSMIACAKHFAGYGAAEGGRDYNTTVINESLLHNIYLPPFRKAVEAGAQTFMSGFNELNGIPVTGNKYLLTDVLKNDWKFDGFVVSDWNSVTEMIAHGYCADDKEAAQKAALAGLDMEMTSQSYEQHLEELIVSGVVSELALDDMVRRILRVKFKMGLFDQPFRVDHPESVLAEEHRTAAQVAAAESIVLLKNDQRVLPLSKDHKIAVIGPMAEAPLDQLGTWVYDGDPDDSVTPIQSLKKIFKPGQLFYDRGMSHSRSLDRSGFSTTIEQARKADVVVFFGGEEAILSGEAHSRAHINLPGVQEDLIREIKEKTGKPIVLVIQAGRPIVLENIIDEVDAILMAWHPGTMGGPAITDCLLGDYNPSGRLPVTWPKSVGQIPIYYNHKNTGRPTDPDAYVGINDIPIGAWQSSLGNDSHYLDDGYLPQYPFGYGLSYSNFIYRNIKVESDSLQAGAPLKISFDIFNDSKTAGIATAQVYVRDVAASITRPVRELKAFERLLLQPNEEKQVKITLDDNALKFYDANLQYVLEPGAFEVYVGDHDQAQLNAKFWVVDER